MKTAYASIVGLLLSISAYAQSSTIAPKHFLWEISGKNLSDKSYLFGSCQFNRADLFHLTDSLFFALNSCQSFAGEVDYSKIDSFMINWTGELGEGQQAEADSTSSGNPFLEGLSIDGGPTLLDNYLYQAASNLGLKIKGLEPLDAVKDFNDDAWQEAGGHSVKERFNRVIEKFLAGDSLDMVRYFEGEGSYWQKVLEVKRRNGVQAKSFIKSARSGSTFGVLGIGHLIGRGGVLELLKKRGYQVRRVGDGKKSDKIQAAYRLPTDEPWYILEDAELGINMRSNADVSLKTDRNFHKGHYSIASNQGLIFFSGFLPKYGALEVDLVQLFKESFFEESTAFTLDSSRVENGVSIHFASGVANKMPFRAQLVEGSRILVFQWVFGFAERSLLSSSVDRYFKGLTLSNFPMSNWKMQHSALGGFNYLFPEGIPFAKNTGKMKEYEERGEISVFYTSYKDSTFGDEYLIRYSDLPSGITYTDTYQSNSIIIRNFAGTYQADVQDFQYHPHGGYLGASATLIDSFDNAFFVQTLIRGAELFLQLQKSPTQTRNTDFFAALELSSPVPESFTTLTYKDAGFQMKATAKHYESRTEEEGELTESYEFNVANTGISTAVNFLKLGAYDELNWHDTLIRIDKVAEELSFDSLISFETYKYGNICPAYLLRYQQDTAMLQGRKIGIFCNDHLISVDISAPIPVAYTAIVDSLIQSIQLDINENSFASMLEPKDMKILTDLTSPDTTIFREALAAFNDYEGFTTDHLPAICELLPEELLDEGVAYGAKYDIITKLHAFEMAAVEDALVGYYAHCKDPIVRARIVESMSQKTSESALENLWLLLDQTEEDQELPADLFSVYRDSLALFQQDYVRIKSLLERGVAIPQSLGLFVDYMDVEGVEAMIQADSVWLQTRIQKEIAAFRILVEQDSTESISAFIMDYLLNTDLDEQEKELYRTLTEAEDVYGKYRVVHNSLLQGQRVSDQLLEEVTSNDYYHYWALKAFHQSQRELPSVLADQEQIAQAIMKHYIYNKLDYQSETCALIRVLPKDATVHDGNYLFMRCASEGEQSYYLGCVGPFDNQGKFDFDQEKSAYFNTPQMATDPETLLQVLLDYIDKL